MRVIVFALRWEALIRAFEVRSDDSAAREIRLATVMILTMIMMLVDSPSSMFSKRTYDIDMILKCSARSLQCSEITPLMFLPLKLGHGPLWDSTHMPMYLIWDKARRISLHCYSNCSRPDFLASQVLSHSQRLLDYLPKWDFKPLNDHKTQVHLWVGSLLQAVNPSESRCHDYSYQPSLTSSISDLHWDTSNHLLYKSSDPRVQ